MKENAPAKLQQLLSDKKALAALARSPDAQALAKMLSQGGDQAALQQAAQAAARGDPAQITEMVNRLMQSPQGAALAERIQRAVQK